MKQLTASEKKRAQILASAIRQEIEALGLTVNQFALQWGERHGLRQRTLSSVVGGNGASASTLDRLAAALSDATGRQLTASSLMALRDAQPGEEMSRPDIGRVEADSCLRALRALPWAELVRIAPEAMRLLVDAIEGRVAPPLRKIQILIESERVKSGLGIGAFAKSKGLNPAVLERIASGASTDVIGATWDDVVSISEQVRDFDGNYGNLGLFCFLFGGIGMDRISRMVAAFMAAEGIDSPSQLMARLLEDSELTASDLSPSERKEILTGLKLVLNSEAGLHDKEVASVLGLLATSMGFGGDVAALAGTAQQIGAD